MTYGVTNDGFVRKPFSVIRSEIEDYQRANIDPGLILSDRSVLGQVNVAVANQAAELWELGQGVYASQYPDSSNGWNLDQVCSLTGTRRNNSTKTTVTGQVTLNPFKNLPAGSVANLTSQPNKRFITLTEVPADPAGGTFDVVFEAEEPGATQVAIGQLNEIAEPVDGWTAVDNAADGVTGAQREEDDQLRTKRENELESQGSTNVDSIRADLLSVTGVLAARVFENDKDIVSGSMPPHSIHCILRGGAAADVGQAIFDTKAAGIDTTIGAQAVVITDSQGFDHTMRFDFATEKVVHVETTILTDPDVFDVVQGPIDIKANVAAYINGLDIGADVIYDQVKCAIVAVAGVVKTTVLKQGFTDPPTITTDLTIAAGEYASSDVANIDVTVT